MKGLVKNRQRDPVEPGAPSPAEWDRRLQEAYRMLREVARGPAGRHAPPTYARTEGVNAAFAKVAPWRWKDHWESSRHLAAYCFLTLADLWRSEWRKRARRRDLIPHALLRLERLGETATAELPYDEARAIARLVEELRADPLVTRAHKIARVAECRLLLGWTIRRTARVLHRGETAVKDDLAFFRAWVRAGAKDDLAWYGAALERLEADPVVSDGPLLARLARREADGEGLATIAADLGLRTDELEAHLAFVRSYVALLACEGWRGEPGLDEDDEPPGAAEPEHEAAPAEAPAETGRAGLAPDEVIEEAGRTLARLGELDWERT